jgi:signal transduction histidine kinase
MLRNTGAKIAAVQALLYFAVGAGFVLTTGRLFEGRRLVEVVTALVVGAAVIALLAALLVFGLLTRRLRELTTAIEHFRAGGFTRPIRLTSARASGDDIDRLGAAVQEMSERIAAQIGLLERADALRRELLANVSHDLRTPLASIQGYLEIMLLKHDSLPPGERHEYLMVAARHTEHLGRLIGDLFQLTKLEAHEVEPTLEPFALAELAQDVVQKHQLSASSRGLRLEVRLVAEPVPLHADIAMIERVLENLIDNALRHTPAGGLVRVEVDSRDGRALVLVSDTGCGIADDEIAHVFDRYYRADRAEAGTSAGTGLGLAIVRKIVELHGGQMKVRSTLGQGTTFSFELPGTAPAAPGPAPNGPG